MSKQTKPGKASREEALEVLLEDVNIDKAEEALTYWFQIAVDHNGGADKDDIKCYTALIKFFRKLR